jgi:hypothetical protein
VCHGVSPFGFPQVRAMLGRGLFHRHEGWMNRRGGGDGVNVGSGGTWRRSLGSGEELGRRREVGRHACGFAPAYYPIGQRRPPGTLPSAERNPPMSQVLLMDGHPAMGTRRLSMCMNEDWPKSSLAALCWMLFIMSRLDPMPSFLLA